jgi:hypothetical protein
MKTHFIFNKFFSENRTVYEIMSKNVVEIEEPQMTSQYGAYALRAGLARLYARMRMHAPRGLGTHTHARTHARTRKHAHRDQYEILVFFTATMVSCTRLIFKSRKSQCLKSTCMTTGYKCMQEATG